ncbi:MAG TPA: methylated-DNA--[protein]-cysteine S-methyltransferase [Candidatus Elarobacter sp.]|jgi:methylated-DNA-[protein]-cysteine S-methyltransferase
MNATGFALFPTAIGHCAIAWSGRDIVGSQLPGNDESATRRRMQRRFPDAREAPPPPNVVRAIDGVTALLAGEHDDLSGITLHTSDLAEFDRRVYAAARAIPPGETITYGELAKRIGESHGAQAVGQTLGRNPFAPIVPCHRIVAADGTMHGFSAAGGVNTKLHLLTIEGWRSAEPTLFEPA